MKFTRVRFAFDVVLSGLQSEPDDEVLRALERKFGEAPFKLTALEAAAFEVLEDAQFHRLCVKCAANVDDVEAHARTLCCLGRLALASGWKPPAQRLTARARRRAGCGRAR